MAIRKCRNCGLEAHNEEELEPFVKNPTGKEGRRNICRKCYNKETQERNRTEDFNLRRRFKDMKLRCYDPRHSSYPYYGGRGIIIVQEWLDDPKSFVDWALANGFKKELEIDRIDNDGPYSPDNCHWVSNSQQLKNRRPIVRDERGRFSRSASKLMGGTNTY